jgi:uncharacterized protein YcgI (DUF1989 family)
MSETPTVREQRVMPPGGYWAAEIAPGERLRISQVDGEQVCDLLSFNRADPREQLSMFASCAVNKCWRLTAPHTLYSNRSQPMWQIEEDTVRENYCGGGWCSAHLNDRRSGKPENPNCEDNLTAALAPFGLDRWSFYPDACFNVFMTVAYEPDGRWEIREPRGRAGDYMVLRALMPQIVAISNCPQVLNPVNNYQLKPLQVEILR